MENVGYGAQTPQPKGPALFSAQGVILPPGFSMTITNNQTPSAMNHAQSPIAKSPHGLPSGRSQQVPAEVLQPKYSLMTGAEATSSERKLLGGAPKPSPPPASSAQNQRPDSEDSSCSGSKRLTGRGSKAGKETQDKRAKKAESLRSSCIL